MSKKNSNVNLKNGFENFEDLSKIFINFKDKLNNLNKKSYVVAVSGGPDSLALVALTRAYNFFRKTKFYYILIDHNIRKNSNKEAQKVKKILNEKKIFLKIFLNKKKITHNIQANARYTRYTLLGEFCKKNNVKTILTAHNLEDQVETFFIRLSRGSGLRGLSSMRPLTKICNQLHLFRPLLDIKKRFLIKISKNVFGKYVNDPSNNDAKYLRTRIRNLKYSLEKSGVRYDQIFKSIQNLSYSRITLENYLNTIFKRTIKIDKNIISINFRKYQNLSKDTKMALLNESIKRLKNNYYDTRSKKVDNLINNLNKKNFKQATLAGCIFFKKGKNLCLKVEKL